MTIDIEPLRKTLGRKIEDEDTVTEAPLKAMIATFDRPDKAPGPGEPIAPGWHLCFLHSYARRESLGRDGAAFEGGVLPKIPMPRRMYAGSTFTFDGEIRVGDKLRREIEFTDIQQRSGSTGNLIVTTQTRRIFTPRGLALTEAASTVFREDPKPGEKSGVPVRDPAPSDVPWRRTIKPDPVMLFRYSAITFNPHRIHYDRTYCIETEGLSRPSGAWAVRPAMHLRPAARFDAGAEDQDACRARPRAAVRYRAVRGDRPADGGRQGRRALDGDAQGHHRRPGDGDACLAAWTSSPRRMA
jgi:3-methylfumaryl-CoA hydratase